MNELKFHKGRGALSNATGRFESAASEAFDDGWDIPLEVIKPRTEIHSDSSRSVIAFNQSPDIPFDRSVNPYRGCEHGCIYCFARPTHAYLGLSAGLDFETQLFAKHDAAALLEKAFRKPGYECQPLALGVNTDAYQPIEKQLGITRRVLEVVREYRHPVSVITKSALVERDMDILKDLAADNLVSAAISVTTLDDAIARTLEPRTAAPRRRLRTIETLATAGVPVSVSVAPIIPVLTDPELESILEHAAARGATSASYIMLRLPLEIADLFQQWLTQHFPLKAEHVMKRVRDTRGGKDYDSRFGVRLRGTGAFAEIINRRFHRARKRFGLQRRELDLDCTQFRVPGRSGDQISLFE